MATARDMMLEAAQDEARRVKRADMAGRLGEGGACGDTARARDSADEVRCLDADAQAAGGGAEERGAQGEGVGEVLAAGGDGHDGGCSEQRGAAHVIALVGARARARGYERQLQLVVAAACEQRQAVAVEQHAACDGVTRSAWGGGWHQCHLWRGNEAGSGRGRRRRRMTRG